MPLSVLRAIWRKVVPEIARRAFGRWIQPVAFEAACIYGAMKMGSAGQGPVTVVGFFSGASGIAALAQRTSLALSILGIEHRCIDISDFPEQPPCYSSQAWIFCLNPPELMPLLARWGFGRLSGVRFGYWAWELLRAPASWMRAIKAFDAVLLPSTHALNAFEGARRPLYVLPLPIWNESPANVRPVRGADDPFRVVSLFDVKSSLARKNPMAGLDAFRLAFSNDPNVRMTLKTQNGHEAPELINALRTRAGPNVEIIDEVWDRARTLNFIATADALISLHRAEGFGLVLAEAMMLGTPVVATGWSANLDFMTEDTACLVSSRLVPVDDPQGIYKGQSWAEPDVEEAALCLRRLRDEPDFAEAQAGRAVEDLINRLAPQAWLRMLPDALRKAMTIR